MVEVGDVRVVGGRVVATDVSEVSLMGGVVAELMLIQVLLVGLCVLNKLEVMGVVIVRIELGGRLVG